MPKSGWPFLGALLIAAAAADARGAERWLEVKSDHFHAYTNGSEREGRDVVTGFEQLRRLFQDLGHLRVDPPAPIVILAARDEATLRSIVPWYWERHGGVRPAGVFMAGETKHYIVLDLSVDPDFRDDVVYHEYVHLITKLNFPGLPIWLNEGLAEFYAGTSVRSGKVVYGRVNPHRLAVLRREAPLPLARLFAIDGSSREYNESSRASMLYAESALLTHYFLLGDGGAHRAALVRYLGLRLEGASDPAAQKEAFGNLGALQNSFLAYANKRMFLAMQSPLDTAAGRTTTRPASAAEVMAARAEVLGSHGRMAEARLLAGQARTLDPGLALPLQVLGTLEEEAGSADLARQDFAEAARLAPDDVMPLYLLAALLAKDQLAPTDLAASEAALRRALQLDEAFAPAHFQLSAVLHQRGLLPDAFRELDRACTLDPDNVAYWARRADLLRELKHPDIADRVEKLLLQMAPNDPAKLAALAAYYRAAQRPADLERLLRSAREMNPGSAQPVLLLAALYRDQGRGDDEQAAYAAALLLQPDDPSLLNQVAYLNADRGVKLPESLALIERALKRRPDSPHFLDTKGWILFRMDRLDEAEKLLRRALELGGDADVLEHLGDLQDRRGQKAAAAGSWQKALDGPGASDELKARLRAKLGPSAPAAPAPPKS